MGDDDKVPKVWDLDAEVHAPSFFERDQPRPLWEPRPTDASLPEPTDFTSVIAPKIVLDLETLTLTPLSPEVDVAGHLHALRATPLPPGYVFDPRGQLRPCERLRLPWMDVGLAVDGSGVVVVDRPTNWTPEGLADVLGVSTRGRESCRSYFGSDAWRRPLRRVIAEGEPFTVLFAMSGGMMFLALDARIVEGVAQFRRASLFPPFDDEEDAAPWNDDLTAHLDPTLWSDSPSLVHPLVAREVAAWLREHTPPRETRTWTTWRTKPSTLCGPTDHRSRWRQEIRRHLVPDAWPEIGVAKVPARVWLARHYPARIGAALRGWRTRHPTSAQSRAQLADQLTLWSAAQEVDPGETAPDRTARLAWTTRHIDIAPLPLLTELAAERLRARADATSLNTVRDALRARWKVIVSHDTREPLPALQTWDAPPALTKRTASREAARIVGDTFLMTAALDLRLGYRLRFLEESWTIPLPPAMGASLLPWFDGGAKPPAHAGDELVGLLSALAAGVHDPGRPFEVLKDGDVLVEACWRLGAMWFRHADWSEWTRDLGCVLGPHIALREPPEVHAALHVYLRPWLRSYGMKGTRNGRAWAEVASSLRPPYPQHDHVAGLDRGSR